MTASTNKTSPKRRLLLASDRTDHSSELATILQSVGEVETVATSEIPDKPQQLSGVVVDINLRSPESVQMVRNKLRSEAYREMPRLFVLADALHHGSMQAWALGATDTIARPLDARGVLQRIRAAFPNPADEDFLARGKKSIVLDLKTSRDRDVALRLARISDVVVDSFRPATATPRVDLRGD